VKAKIVFRVEKNYFNNNPVFKSSYARIGPILTSLRAGCIIELIN